MTREEKQLLLLKDLCARLPYGVKVDVSSVEEWKELTLTPFILSNYYDDIEKIKPYLRPMSSMTDEEISEFQKRLKIVQDVEQTLHFCNTVESIDWLNAHHFDYRGLIKKGLALEAPAGMYNKGEPEKGSDIPIPKTVDEAISTLEKILSDEDREYLLENGAISMHDSLGRWIRNEWGLWTGSELKDELMNMNKGLNHPDDMSNYIIEEFIKYWNNKV